MTAVTAGTLKATPESFCVFVGHPRTGSTLVGAVLDAHPDVVLAHQILAVRMLLRDRMPRDEVFARIAESSAAAPFAHDERMRNGYRYHVRGQWQGRWRTPRVLGDKNAGMTARFLGVAPPDVRAANRAPRLEVIERLVGCPLRLVRVVRRPEDTVTSIMRKTTRHPGPDEAVDLFLELCSINRRLRDNTAPDAYHLIRLEELIERPHASIEGLLAFLGLDKPDGFVDAASSIVFAKPAAPGGGEAVETLDDDPGEQLRPEHSERLRDALADDPAYATYFA